MRLFILLCALMASLSTHTVRTMEANYNQADGARTPSPSYDGSDKASNGTEDAAIQEIYGELDALVTRIETLEKRRRVPRKFKNFVVELASRVNHLENNTEETVLNDEEYEEHEAYEETTHSESDEPVETPQDGITKLSQELSEVRSELAALKALMNQPTLLQRCSAFLGMRKQPRIEAQPEASKKPRTETTSN